MANNTSHKFIQFGCWNNLNEGKGCLINVMNKLKEHIENDKPEFLVISGDNYYPDKGSDKKKKDKKTEGEAEETGTEKKKEKKDKKTKEDDEKGAENKKADKKKMIHLQNLRDGFNLLPDIKTYMILGNHDLETNVNKNKLFINNDTPENDCQILETQFESIKDKNIDYCLFKSKQLNDNTVLIMVDTSIYEEEPEDYLQCYKKFLKIKKNEVVELQQIIKKNKLQYQISNKPYKENEIFIKSLKMYQVMEINKKIDSYKNVIIVGHHPIIRTRIKKDVITTGTDIPSFTHALSQIFIPDKNYYYLCSDLHLFQNGTIVLDTKYGNMIIQQMIVGTGGTELDDTISEHVQFPHETTDIISFKEMNEKEEKKEIHKYMFKYRVDNDIKTCGFLECDFKTEPSFKFISIEEKKSLNTIHFSDMELEFSSLSSHGKGAAAVVNGGSRRRRVRKTMKSKTANKMKRMNTRIVRKMKKTRKNI